MPIPTGGDTPSRYKPNPIDDRAVTDPEASAVYLALATAIEACEQVIDGNRNVYLSLDHGTRRGIRTAEAALRRAAFSLVLHAPDPS